MVAERIVEVEWEDSHCSHGWQKELPSVPPPVVSVGYVGSDDETGIVLYEAWDGAPTPEDRERSRYGCATAIPRSAIRKVRELRRGR